MKFQVNTTGFITAIKFYKYAGNTGTHVGSIWTSDGTLLARATFSNETPSGWQRVGLSSPLSVTPGTTYVVSYFAPNGKYAQTINGFATQVTSSGGQIVAPASAAIAGNGVYLYHANGFPNRTYNASNYWVDVEFTTPAQAPTAAPAEVSIWNTSTQPGYSSADTGAVELGMKFRATVGGSILGVRFHKAIGNTGTHIGSLWTSSGTRLAQVTFLNETASGWQEARFASPVAITADTTYVVSYFAPAGRYSHNTNFFSSAVTNGDLRALADGESGGNGLYKYGSASTFPNNSYVASNYWVDVVFAAGAVSPPPVITSVTVAPTSATLTASQQRQFSATISGTSPGLNWSISPAVGTISSLGLYTAPSSITSTQTVTVTATSVADSTKKATATITLNTTAPADTTAPTVTVVSPANGSTVSGTVNLNANASDASGVAGVRFRVGSTNVGAEVLSAPYTTTWDTRGLANGSYTITAIARDTLGNTGTATISVIVANTVSSKIKFPIEVMGPTGGTQVVQLNLGPGALTATRLFLQIHGLNYDGQASVQINGGAWMPITGSTVTLDPLSSAYGGIGGGFHTVKLSMPIPVGSLFAGTNNIGFRFTYNGGDTTGFRVLKMNLLSALGTFLISDSDFVQEDVSSWQPPRSSSSDITEGRRLWYEAALIRDPLSRSSIRARCTDCHAHDGRDLKYYNYSNHSIVTRSVFHGLTTVQGEQIASYIRTLNVNNPGRPWNPPYQPGPGVDSRPANEWAAGAGIDAVLDADKSTLDYIDLSHYSSKTNLSARETPIAMQMPDWNRWLPQVHPKDAYGDTFINHPFNTTYNTLRSVLKFRDSGALVNATSTLSYWEVRRYEMIPEQSSWSTATRRNVYSASLWKLTKLWELMNEFELQEFGRELYGPQADVRAWWDHDSFLTSPNMLKITPGPGMANGTAIGREYFAQMWYHMQLLLNNSNKRQGDNSPIDWPYVYGFIKTLSSSSPQAGFQTLWMIKAMQITDNGKGPEFGESASGWHWRVADLSRLVHGDLQEGWSDLSWTARRDIYERLTRTWMDMVKGFAPSQFYVTGVASPTESISAAADGNFGQRMWYTIPRLRYYGVSQTLINELADWSQSVWRASNWTPLKTATCYGGNHLNCTSDK